MFALPGQKGREDERVVLDGSEGIEFTFELPSSGGGSFELGRLSYDLENGALLLVSLSPGSLRVRQLIFDLSKIEYRHEVIESLM